MLVGHEKQWKFLERKFQSGALAHAYLFAGQEGIGKKMLALEFAEFIGCKFPDLKIVTKKDDKTEIDISQIREVQNFLSYKSYNGGYKTVIIDNAHLMNQEAQSCFLKTLEEPKGKTLLVLISSKPDLLLATITSRCQTIKFFPVQGGSASGGKLNLEKLAREKEILNAVLPVINSSLAEKFKYVKSLDFEKQNALEIVEVLQRYFREQLLKNLEDKTAIRFLKASQEISQKLLFTNANPKLALEILLMEI